MARPPRIEVPFGYYHLATRGNSKQPIVHDDGQRRLFFGHLDRVRRRFDWTIVAYCLMTNHYHLVLQISDRGLSRGMCELNGGFAHAINAALGRCDHLFGKRFWSGTLEEDGDVLTACRYVDRNPCSAGICGHPGRFLWSGYRAAVGRALPERFHAVTELHRLLGASTAARGAAAYAAFVRAGDGGTDARAALVPSAAISTAPTPPLQSAV
jgi:REP element-mobilizing transposase RayT